MRTGDPSAKLPALSALLAFLQVFEACVEHLFYPAQFRTPGLPHVVKRASICPRRSLNRELFIKIPVSTASVGTPMASAVWSVASAMVQSYRFRPSLAPYETTAYNGA